MKALKIPLAAIISVVILIGFIVTASKPRFWNFIQTEATIAMFEDKNISDLTSDQKYLLFDAYYKKRDMIKALMLADQLKDQADSLPSEVRITIAGRVAKILRADKKFDFEFIFYDKLLKQNDEEYYHLFKGDSYKIQGNLSLAKEEFLKAKQLAHQPQLIQTINSELEKMV